MTTVTAATRSRALTTIKFGTDMAEYVIGYAQETWPDADPSVVGMLSMDFSLSPQIHVRTEASKEIFLAAGYPEENFFVADGASTGLLNADTGYNLSGPIFASNPQIEYWLICACLDDYADGAIRVAEQNGLADKSIATTCGGSGLINHWDAGEESSWKSAVYCAQDTVCRADFLRPVRVCKRRYDTGGYLA